MSVSPGTRLGSYEILVAIGAGGMGEVYRARDSKLGRSVAIKVLPPAFATDADRISRFEREARALAALNHPHIATLYGLEQAEGQSFLVMELVEGLTLAELIQSRRSETGGLAMTDVLSIARQIAEALEAAHEKGIVHRDLKPANVKITPEDKVKVLDFGLAKAIDPADARTPGTSLMNSPTVSAMGTQAGVILGTASYMSPEQARGFPVDHRADIFSFGVVLYEMLSGRQPFQGETVSDVLASVLVRDPDLGALPTTVHPQLIDLVRRCLEKHPRRRWQAIGDVRYELDVIAAAPTGAPAVQAPAPAPSAPFWKRAMPAIGFALLASAITAVVVWSARPQPPAPPVTRFAITLDPGDGFRGNTRAMLAVSPDGKMIAYSAGRPAMLYVRPIGDLHPRPVRGSEENSSAPTGPLFSPDGESLAYWTNVDQTLRRIPVAGGAPVTICKTELPSGMTWTADGIVFANTEGIQRVSPNGGQPEVLVKTADDEAAFGPELLPGGHAVLFTVAQAGGTGEKWERAKVVVQPLPSGARRTILEGASDARYLSSGYLVFARAGVIFAASFDADRLVVTGKEVPVVEGVRRGSGMIGAASANFSVSDTGTLAYIPGPLETMASQLHVGLFDRAGRGEVLGVPPGAFQEPRLSPDGRRIAFTNDDGKDADIWVYDVGGTQAARRLTFGGHNRSPAWSADSQRVAFQSDRDGDLGIFWQRADGTGTPERLTTAEKDAEHRPLSFAPGGDLFLFDSTTRGRTTLWVFSVRDRKATRFAGLESTNLTSAVFSADGRWVAYAAREAARSNQVYVEPFPQTGAKYQISNASEDAHHPLWSPDGTELFYTPGPGTRLIRVPIVTKPTFSFGASSALERPFTNAAGSVERTYDITRDGQRFVALTESQQTSGPAGVAVIDVVLNWIDELRTRVPAGK